ncbi:MAG: response regulator, partial [Deltaproteobacteria bacterium]
MPKQILLADDSITIQKVIALTFAGEDYNITSVDNGADAITKAREIRPDIILADVVMPQKNGYEVCETIKNDPAMKGTPVLLLAGTFEPFDEDQAKKSGADGHIIKPFESQALIRKVKELVGARAAMPVTAPTPVAAPKVAPTVTPAAPIPPRPAVPPAAPAPPISRPVVVPAAVPVPPKPPVTQPAAPLQPMPTVIQPPVTPEVRPLPAAHPKPPAPPTAAPIVPPAPPAEEDFWGTFMEEAEEEKAPVEAVIPETLEAAVPIPEEEAWDIGEFEELAPSGEIVPAAEKEEEELWGTFAFEDTGEGEVEEVMEEPLLEEVAPAEEEFGFVAEETPLGGGLEPLQEAAEEEFAFGVEEIAEPEIEEVSEFELGEVPVGVEEPLPAESEEFAFIEEEAEIPSEPEVEIEPSP